PRPAPARPRGLVLGGGRAGTLRAARFPGGRAAGPVLRLLRRVPGRGRRDRLRHPLLPPAAREPGAGGAAPAVGLCRLRDRAFLRLPGREPGQDRLGAGPGPRAARRPRGLSAPGAGGPRRAPLSVGAGARAAPGRSNTALPHSTGACASADAAPRSPGTGKVYPDAASALQGLVADGQTLAVGGFGLCGIPEALIAALRDSGATSLTVISNNAGVDGFGLGMLLETRQIR